MDTPLNVLQFTLSLLNNMTGIFNYINEQPTNQITSMYLKLE